MHTQRAIKLSSPKLSNITAVGCILVYAAVVLLGLDYSTLPANDKAFPAVCTVSVFHNTDTSKYGIHTTFA